jgi:hypothetical protein
MASVAEQETTVVVHVTRNVPTVVTEMNGEVVVVAILKEEATRASL